MLLLHLVIFFTFEIIVVGTLSRQWIKVHPVLTFEIRYFIGLFLLKCLCFWFIGLLLVLFWCPLSWHLLFCLSFCPHPSSQPSLYSFLYWQRRHHQLCHPFSLLSSQHLHHHLFYHHSLSYLIVFPCSLSGLTILYYPVQFSWPQAFHHLYSVHYISSILGTHCTLGNWLSICRVFLGRLQLLRHLYPLRVLVSLFSYVW